MVRDLIPFYHIILCIGMCVRTTKSFSYLVTVATSYRIVKSGSSPRPRGGDTNLRIESEY